jgi:hypothetical protein
MRDTAPVAERLPDDIVERMRRLQEAAGAGTTPFPGVDRAVRRHRRRAVATGAAALTLVTAVGGAVLTGAGRDRTTVSPATPPPSPSASVAEPIPSPTPPGPWQNRRRPGAPVPQAPTGFGPIAGSLAGDGAWLAALRRTIATRNQADGPDQVHVLWAGEVEGQRYAVAVAPDFDRDSGHGDMSWSLWAWRVSADGRRAQPASTGMVVDPGRDVGTISIALDVGDDGLGVVPERSVVLVVDARARSVEIGGPSRYPAAGGKERTFTPLVGEGVVWPAVQTRDQLLHGLLRITAEDGTRRNGGMADYGGVGRPPSFAPVAPPDADRDLLRCAAGGWSEDAPGGAVPLLAGTTRAAGSGWAVGVLRAREGGYLLGACRDHGFVPGTRYVAPAPAGGPDRLTALLAMDRMGDGRGQVFTVIAPADATTVELGGRSAPVRQRIAVIDLGERRPLDGLQVTARRADGGVAGTAGAAATDVDLDRQFVDEGLPAD